MKKKAVLLAALIVASTIAAEAPTAVYAAESSAFAAGTALDAISSVAAGNPVSISGTSNATEIIIKVIAPDQTILFFDIVKSSNGRFQDSFTLPSTAIVGSTYQVVAGQGTDVATRSFSVTSSSTNTSSPDIPITGPGGAGDGKDTPTNSATNTVKFKPTDLSGPSNGTVTLDASKSSGAVSQIMFPASIVQSIDNNSLRILLPNGSVTLPKEVLLALTSLSGTDTEANLSLNVTALSNAETLGAISRVASAGTELTPQGALLELSLAVVLKDGSSKKLTTFVKPVKLQLKLTAGADARLAGIYYISDTGSIDYIGGSLSDQTLTANITHFSKYGVFTYSKSYSDVPSNYWAFDIIQVLTAKHVIQGASNDAFGPKTNVTRAEFTTMLVRALDLKASAPAPFSDVKAASWYADSIAAAYENGIVIGSDKGTFEPSKVITREEMASMIVRVYEKRTGPINGSASDLAAFKDVQAISGWAKEAVQNAVHAGLMSGNSMLFAPKNNATRAEAAAVLYNLLYRS